MIPSAISGSEFAVLQGVDHKCYPESAATFDAEVRPFLVASCEE